MIAIAIQTILLLTAAFFIGCVAGCWSARQFRKSVPAHGTVAKPTAEKSTIKRKKTTRGGKSR